MGTRRRRRAHGGGSRARGSRRGAARRWPDPRRGATAVAERGQPGQGLQSPGHVGAALREVRHPWRRRQSSCKIGLRDVGSHRAFSQGGHDEIVRQALIDVVGLASHRKVAILDPSVSAWTSSSAAVPADEAIAPLPPRLLPRPRPAPPHRRESRPGRWWAKAAGPVTRSTTRSTLDDPDAEDDGLAGHELVARQLGGTVIVTAPPEPARTSGPASVPRRRLGRSRTWCPHRKAPPMTDGMPHLSGLLAQAQQMQAQLGAGPAGARCGAESERPVRGWSGAGDRHRRW